eukprot:SAG31_NODE_1531_length_7992_cov_2.794121_7_plen_62_part_01
MLRIEDKFNFCTVAAVVVLRTAQTDQRPSFFFAVRTECRDYSLDMLQMFYLPLWVGVFFGLD